MIGRVHEEPPARIKCDPVTCPSCRNPPYALVEIWNGAGLSFDYDASDGTRSGYGIQTEGTPSGVLAKCRCGHQWKLRSIDQITDLNADGSLE